MLRRRAILKIPIARPDTSPRIAEYYKRLVGATGTAESSIACYTEWITTNPATFIGEQPAVSLGGITIDTSHVFQYEKENGTYDYWYTAKPYLESGAKHVRFTLDIDTLSSAYAYNKYSGQIYFAGQDTIYYGYTNINDMP